mmetsp:Transcript_71646/g.164198  ORF Transcript_71646/g.164198 Transcript_71646/m.164198 type:complete len:238 (-) Transcript_71646:1268-1981(-)
MPLPLGAAEPSVLALIGRGRSINITLRGLCRHLLHDLRHHARLQLLLRVRLFILLCDRRKHSPHIAAQLQELEECEECSKNQIPRHKAGGHGSQRSTCWCTEAQAVGVAIWAGGCSRSVGTIATLRLTDRLRRDFVLVHQTEDGEDCCSHTPGQTMNVVAVDGVHTDSGQHQRGEDRTSPGLQPHIPVVRGIAHAVVVHAVGERPVAYGGHEPDADGGIVSAGGRGESLGEDDQTHE